MVRLITVETLRGERWDDSCVGLERSNAKREQTLINQRVSIKHNCSAREKTRREDSDNSESFHKIELLILICIKEI